MLSIHPLPDPSDLRPLKAAYLEGLLAPLDGMWEVGFIQAAPHFEIRLDGQQAGYCVIDQESTLTQFFVKAELQAHGRALLEQVLAQRSVTHAIAFTLDPYFLSLCLDLQVGVKVHSYLYELPTAGAGPCEEIEELTFRPLSETELQRTIEFQRSCLSGDAQLTEWLTSYSANLIDREELFVLSQHEEWIGLGECRRSDSQAGVADVGMMVAPSQRRRGWATDILRRLCAHCVANGLRPICSTTVANVGAQRAITNAGFISRHRILDVAF